MSNYNKSIPRYSVYEKYRTRKDYHHTYKGYFMSYYPKKIIRHQANIKLRRYKGDFGQNGWYKRFSEVMWIVV